MAISGGKMSMSGDYWDYVNALSYALAKGTPKTPQRFTGDPMQWHQAMYELLPRYKDRLPVFRHIVFDTTPGRQPFSAEVDHFLHVLAQSRLLSALNTAYAVFEFSDKQKETIIRLNEKRVKQYEGVLEELGRELAAKVLV
ncbi:MAG: hypothetical protein Q7K03_07510 [Dehalococcoidia bacterium]|nr:hypothetical protein [Dehalococcoidia bacterium]